MEESELRKLVTDTGLSLLQDGLVARTWGNVSARVDDEHYLITPSGLDYTQTLPEDLALMDISSEGWTGPRKPSSEKKVHTAAYQVFPEVNFVIHTHQVYATALGVCGFDKMTVTQHEKEKLGGIALADYGMPGTDKLTQNVRKAMENGAHTILMKHHGVVITGTSREDAYEKIKLLESICQREWKGNTLSIKKRYEDQDTKDKLLSAVRKSCPNAAWEDSWASRKWASTGEQLPAQIDDMAMMIGARIPMVSASLQGLTAALNRYHAVFILPYGAIVCGQDEDDTQALKLLTEKAAVCALHTMACGGHQKLSLVDCLLMNMVYKKKYSKQKNKTTEVPHEQ